MAPPETVCDTSGWNWIPHIRRSGCSNATTGALAVAAVTAKPGGGVATWSPWLIHTVSRAVQPGKEQTRLDDVDLGAAVLAAGAGLDPAAQRLGHQLHAVADAQHRDAEVEQLGRRLRRPGGVRRSAGRRRGSPRSGWRRRISSIGRSKGWTSQ